MDLFVYSSFLEVVLSIVILHYVEFFKFWIPDFGFFKISVSDFVRVSVGNAEEIDLKPMLMQRSAESASFHFHWIFSHSLNF